MEIKKSKIKDIIRKIFGWFNIILGIYCILCKNIPYGLGTLLFGITVLPVIYKKANLDIEKYKWIQVILPIIIITITIVFLQPSGSFVTNLEP